MLLGVAIFLWVLHDVNSQFSLTLFRLKSYFPDIWKLRAELQLKQNTWWCAERYFFILVKYEEQYRRCYCFPIVQKCLTAKEAVFRITYLYNSISSFTHSRYFQQQKNQYLHLEYVGRDILECQRWNFQYNLCLSVFNVHYFHLSYQIWNNTDQIQSVAWYVPICLKPALRDRLKMILKNPRLFNLMSIMVVMMMLMVTNGSKPFKVSFHN